MAILEEIGINSSFTEWLTLPKDIEITVRTNEKTKEDFVFLLNYSSRKQNVKINGRAYDLLSDNIIEENVIVEPFGVMILTIK